MGAVTKNYKKGENVFTEGQPSSSLVVVQTGTVEIRKAKGSGYIEIAKVYANEVIGEMSFFDRLPRSASAIAHTDVVAIEIPFDALDKVYNSVPPYFKTFMSCMAERLRKADEKIRKLEKNFIEEETNLSDDDAAVNNVLKDLSTTDSASAANAMAAETGEEEKPKGDLESQFNEISDEMEKDKK